MYATPVQNVESLDDRIVEGCESIRNSPGLHKLNQESMRRHIDTYLYADGGYLEHLTIT